MCDMERDFTDGAVTLVIRAPNQKYDDHTVNCSLGWTVERLKAHLSDVYPCKPCTKDQRLVYSGRLLLNHLKLKDVLRKQDEYYTLHLVCASHTPPPSPHTRKRNSAKLLSSSTNSTSSTPVQSGQSPSPTGTHDRLSANVNPALNHIPNPFTWQGHPWAQPPAQAGGTVGVPQSHMYNPMTLLWWQQVYAWHYYMYYQSLAAASPAPRAASPSAQAEPPREGRGHALEAPPNGPMEDGLNDDEVNPDWLDWFYTVSRAVILLSIVYFYSSFSRFVIVTGAMLLLYLHQAGWLPFNLENELQNFGEGANQDGPDGEPQNDLQEMERMMDEDRGADEGTEDPNEGANAGFFSSAWSFITTFFSSLIPQGLPNAAN